MAYFSKLLAEHGYPALVGHQLTLYAYAMGHLVRPGALLDAQQAGGNCKFHIFTHKGYHPFGIVFADGYSLTARPVVDMESQSVDLFVMTGPTNLCGELIQDYSCLAVGDVHGREAYLDVRRPRFLRLLGKSIRD